MEQKTIDTLRVMLCGEIEEIAKKGNLSHETLDILKDLIETEKGLIKIEKYNKEKEEEKQMQRMNMGMDNGYSQRKYYIDADYDPYQNMNSYNYSMYDGGNSYARNNNSYRYDPRMDQMSMYSMARGYSREDGKQEAIAELQNMLNRTQDAKTRDAIQKILNEMNK